jgi:predicted NAD/FAD-dependent oxidoreductase
VLLTATSTQSSPGRDTIGLVAAAVLADAGWDVLVLEPSRGSTPCSHRLSTARADSAATEIGLRGGVRLARL